MNREQYLAEAEERFKEEHREEIEAFQAFQQEQQAKEEQEYGSEEDDDENAQKEQEEPPVMPTYE